MKFTINPEDFFFDPESGKSLKEIPTSQADLYEDKEAYEKNLESYKEEIFRLQNIMYAHDHFSVLLIFQGMDAAGKDGAVTNVMSGINPAGVSVSSFKKPSTEELDHDFLWRCSKELPERGRIGIFNRSYYEELLIVRVHPEILHSQRIPEKTKNDPDIWKNRFEDIRAYEKFLHRNGTIIIKFFLHVSKDEQKKRFLERIEEPDKNWKFSAFDVSERKYWNEYQNAYGEILKESSRNQAPWYVIPADKKKSARLIISQIIVKHLSNIHMDFPELPEEQKKQLNSMRDSLLSEE